MNPILSTYETVFVCIACFGLAIVIVSWMAWRADR